ncbi:MAG: hypothetical protein IPI69_02980 [Bacteroidales bacterium]|nr:hypothetical protein [Bacteroidales bacterium]
MAQGTERRAQGTGRRAQSTEHRAQGTEHRAQSSVTGLASRAGLAVLRSLLKRHIAYNTSPIIHDTLSCKSLTMRLLTLNAER